MRKVSELNPKDTTLDEIHKIQKKISEEDKGLSPIDKVQRYTSAREEFCKKSKKRLKVISLEKSAK